MSGESNDEEDTEKENKQRCPGHRLKVLNIDKF